MKSINKYIQFEVEVRAASMFPSFGSVSGGGNDRKATTFNDEDYHEATEEDIDLLAQMLSGM